MQHAGQRLFAAVRRVTLVAWPLVWTLVGLAIGGVGLLSGGRVRRAPGIVEFHGGAVAWLLERWPLNALAMTLGHVVLGRTAAVLAASRAHEMVHVRQYERWGPLFVPAYGICALVLWLRGGDGYRDNPFEREAFDTVP